MKILFDHLCFSEKYGGVSKYFTKLIHNLSDEVQYEIAVKYTNNEYIKELSLAKIKRIFENVSFRGKMSIISAINKPYSIRKIKQGDYGIYHQTHYDPYAYRYLPRNKIGITTIYDMNFYVIPEAYGNNRFNFLMRWQKTSAKKANKIIAISNNTKNDLINTWNIPEKKIEVIYLGVEEINIDKDNNKRLYSNPYILFVGQRLFYKNFHNYLKAFKILTQTNPDLILVCTGVPFSKKEMKIFYQIGLSDKIVHISASESKMINLYYNAELFVYPSLHEGFGMPLLEAMNCYCPIICSETSCFPEIAKDAALYFDPYVIESMVETTQKVLDGTEIRKRLIQNGIQRKKDFSWKKCAEEHIRLYNDLYAEYY